MFLFKNLSVIQNYDRILKNIYINFIQKLHNYKLWNSLSYTIQLNWFEN